MDNIVKLRDIKNDSSLPVTHEMAVRDSNGTTLETKLQIIDDKLGSGNYDISAHNSGATYANLSEALGTNGANVPTAYRKGGMSVKFIQSSDHNYVQYRFMLSGSFTDAQFTNVSNWQGVDDEIVPSRNIIENGAVYGSITAISALGNDYGKITTPKPLTGTYTDYEFLRSDGTLNHSGASTNYKVYSYSVTANKCYLIVGRVRATSSAGLYTLFAFYDENNNLLSYGDISKETAADYKRFVKAPQDAVKVNVQIFDEGDGLYEYTSEHTDAEKAEIFSNLGINYSELIDNINSKALFSSDYGIDLSKLELNTYFINSSNKWVTSGNNRSILMSVDPSLEFVYTMGEIGGKIAFLQSIPTGTTVPYANGTSRIDVEAESSYQFTIPSDCKYLYILARNSSGDDCTGTLVKKTIMPKIEKIGILDNSIKQCKKIVDSASASYDGNKVTITSVSMIGIYDGGSDRQTIYADAENHEPVTFTLGVGSRHLVITKDNVIRTRAAFSNITKEDIILLCSNDSGIFGGELFSDYINKMHPIEDIVPDKPYSTGVWNAIKKTEQMMQLPWTAKGTIPYNVGSYTDGQNVVGAPYSSVKEYDQFVFLFISPETFMTAVHNPRSVLYTEDISEEYSQSSIGRVYHGTNGRCYYGCVCSTLISFALGFDYVTNTRCIPLMDDMEFVEDQSSDGAKLGDIVYETGHEKLIIGIDRDKNGIAKYIHIAEMKQDGADVYIANANNLTTKLQRGEYNLYRYKKLYQNRTYVPQTKFVAVEGETLEGYAYNDDLCPNYGDKANYAEGDNIVINIRTDYASAGYSSLEVYKDNILLSTMPISSEDMVLTSLAYGDYKARIVGTGINSEYVYFKVVNMQLTKSGDKLVFSSANSTPMHYCACNITGSLLVGTHGEIVVRFSAQDIQAEEVTPSGEIVPNSTYPYMRVHFKTDYGVITKNILWYE